MSVAQIVAEPLLRLRVECDPKRRAEELWTSSALITVS